MRVLPVSELLVIDDTNRVSFVGQEFAGAIDVEPLELIGVEISRLVPSWSELKEPSDSLGCDC